MVPEDFCRQPVRFIDYLIKIILRLERCEPDTKSPKGDTFCPKYNSCVYLLLVGAGVMSVLV